MALPLRITHYRQPGGEWTVYRFPIQFDTRAELEAYKARSYPTEYLVNYPVEIGWDALKALSPGEWVAPKPPPVVGTAPMVPKNSPPYMESYAPVSAGGATAAEPNPPRFTAPGGTLAGTVRDEAAKISSGAGRPAVGVSTRPRIETAAPAVVPTSPRIIDRTDISAEEPTPPKGYSPLETFPIPQPTVQTGAEPNPPRIDRTTEFFPTPTKLEDNLSPWDRAIKLFGEWWSKPSLEPLVRDAIGFLPVNPASVASTAEPNPPRYTAPATDPGTAPAPTPSSTETPWEKAARLFGQWWTKPSIWDTVKAEFGGILPTDPNAAPERPSPVPQSRPPSTPDPDPVTPPPLDPVPTTTDTTPAAENSGNDIDRYLASLDGVMSTVGKMLDAVNPGPGETAPPNTATASKPNAGASPAMDFPIWGWGGIALLLLFLASKKR